LNVNWHLHFIPKCHLNIWLTQYFRKLIFWMICNKKKLSIERKYPSVSHVSPNVEDGRPIHCIHFKPTKRNPHKSIKGLQVQPIAQVAFDCILFGKSSLTNSYTWWNEYNFFCQSCISLGQFVCHSKLLPHMRQASNIVLFSHSCRSVSVNSKSSPLHMSFSSSVYWNFNNILSSHNLVFVIRSLSSLG